MQGARLCPFPTTQTLLGETRVTGLPYVARGRLGFNSKLKTWIIPGVADEDFSVNVQFFSLLLMSLV